MPDNARVSVNPALLIALGVLAFIRPLEEAVASPEGQSCASDFLWSEERGERFSIIYTEEESDLLRHYVVPYIAGVESDYSRFIDLFGTELQLPIAIRIYPTTQDLSCMNAIVHPPPGAQAHTHVGAREIDLIAVRITNNPTQWHAQAANNFRQELASLFVEKLSRNLAPPGLVYGIGAYTRNPHGDASWVRQIESLSFESPPNWQDLLAEPSALHTGHGPAATASIVAFLVDVYGWDLLVDLVSELATGKELSRTFPEVYGRSMQNLEDQWRDYLPLYSGGRWRAHILYDFDLTPHRGLVSVGGYSAAAIELTNVISFLERTEQSEKRLEAEELLQRAREGEHATALAYTARLALMEGEFDRSLVLISEAKGIYESLGNEARIAELEVYEQRAREVLSLRDELRGYSQTGPAEHADRIREIGARLIELGDKEGSNTSQRILSDISGRWSSITNLLVGVAGVFALFLIWIRLQVIRQATKESGLL